MRAHPRRSTIVICLAALLVAAGCAEPRGHIRPAGTGLDHFAFAGGTTNADGSVTTIDPETGEVVTVGGDGSGLGSDTTGTTTGGSTTGGTTTTGSTSTDDGSSGSETDGGTTEPGEPTGGDTTGVTDDVIKIGIHAPITGAAPVPSDSAAKGARAYYQWMERQGEDLFGRRVEIVLKNDQYNPSHAVAVCKEMVEQDKVFMLQGAAGTDQIQACARYAASVGVPYLSAGVTEAGLTGLPNYFATSMSYPAQGPLMADFLIDELNTADELHAIVYANSSNFIDGKDAFVNAMADRGIEVYQRAVSKNAGTSDAQSVITDLNQRGVENVNLLLPPVFWLQMLQAAGAQNYNPQWVAAGIQMSFDTVATVGCDAGAMDGAKVFSPFPAWIDSNRFDPEFREAISELYADEGSGGDDFMWLGWSSGKGTWDFLERVGPNLTRERFVYMLERGRNLFNGIGPHLTFSPDDHFGASEVHVSQVDCNDRRWHTLMTWMSDF